MILTFSPCSPTPIGPVGPGKPGGPKSPWKGRRLVLHALPMLQMSLMLLYFLWGYTQSKTTSNTLTFLFLSPLNVVFGKCTCAAHLFSFNSHSLLSPRPLWSREPSISLWSKTDHSCQLHQSYPLLIHCQAGVVFSRGRGVKGEQVGSCVLPVIYKDLSWRTCVHL